MPPRSLIMVLDGDASNRRLVALILRSAGHQVLEAEQVAEARQLCAALRVDLVVAQATLPGLEQLVATAEVPAAPLILMSPALSGEMRDRMRALGAVCSVHRPVFVDEIKAAVAGALAAAGRRRAARPLRDEAATAA